MAPHKFAVGDTVRCATALGDPPIPAGPHTVTRTLPGDFRGRLYRVRSSQDGLERVLNESQLSVEGAQRP
jgi:hypothetical protein